MRIKLKKEIALCLQEVIVNLGHYVVRVATLKTQRTDQFLAKHVKTNYKRDLIIKIAKNARIRKLIGLNIQKY